MLILVSNRERPGCCKHPATQHVLVILKSPKDGSRVDDDGRRICSTFFFKVDMGVLPLQGTFSSLSPDCSSLYPLCLSHTHTTLPFQGLLEF